MGGYVAYPEYKDSCVIWLGMIPSTWKIDRAKWSVTSCTNGVWGNEPDGIDDLVCIRVADFDRQSFYVNTHKLTLRAIPHKDQRTRLLKKDDLLLEKSGGGDHQLVGTVVQFNQRFIAVSSNFVAKLSVAENVNSRFLVYVFAHLYSGRVNYRSIKQSIGIQNLDSQLYLDEKIPYPSYSEQQTIARFLDYKTAQIDALIAKKELLLKKLAQKRTAIISHAVTKGLDPSAPMKDSCVPWLGEIPETWSTKRLKFLLASPLKYGANEIAELTDPEFPRYIRITDVNEDGTLRDETFRSLAPEIAKDYLLDDGDILLARSGATIGKSFIYRNTWGNAAYAGYLIRARVSNKLAPDFAYFFLQSDNYWQWLNSVFIQATIQNVSAEKYANLWISIPDIKEQNAIVCYLNTHTRNIDQQKVKAQQAINKLKEYRTSLITHAVTGKIDVREFKQYPNQ